MTSKQSLAMLQTWLVALDSMQKMRCCLAPCQSAEPSAMRRQWQRSRAAHISYETRGPETNGVLQACEELGVGFVPYSPLGKGFLTGTMNENTKLASNDFRSTLPRFTPEAMKANQALVDWLGRIAQKKNAHPGQTTHPL